MMSSISDPYSQILSVDERRFRPGREPRLGREFRDGLMTLLGAACGVWVAGTTCRAPTLACHCRSGERQRRKEIALPCAATKDHCGAGKMPAAARKTGATPCAPTENYCPLRRRGRTHWCAPIKLMLALLYFREGDFELAGGAGFPECDH